MSLMPISDFSQELVTVEAITSPENQLLKELQEKIFLLGQMLNVVQSKLVVDLTALAAKVMPTVVYIEVLGGYETIHGCYKETAGSGCVISSDGYIITNNHVIDGAKKIDVLFHHSGLSFPATLVGTDPETDVALLKIDADEEMPYSKFGNSDLVQIGAPSVLIGNPLAFQNLLTTGVIGGRSVTLCSSGKDHIFAPWDHGLFSEYLFSDTLGNPGSSGGPLFDLQGDIIGVLARGASGPGGGIAMSIASNTAIKIASELKEHGYITRASLGAELVSLNSALVPYLFTLVSKDSIELWEENPVEGLFVSDMLKDSPAMNAGLKKGDFIIRYNDIKVTTQEQFYADLAMRIAPFSDLKLSLIRDGTIIDVIVTLGKRDVNKVVDIEKLGLRVENLEGEKYFIFEFDSELAGVFVHSVDLQSEASMRGLRPADVITAVSIDGYPEIPVCNVDELVKMIDVLEGEHTCVLVVRSHDRSRPSYIPIELC